jgi:hypothetical protein
MLFLVVLQPDVTRINQSTSGECFFKSQASQIGCNLTLFTMDLLMMDSDLVVDIHYQIDYNTSVEQIEIRLYVSLDNDSYVQGFIHKYDTSLLNETTIDAFFSYSNAIGDPLPFDVQEGQTLNTYIEVETENGVIQSAVVSEIIPIDVTRPWLFRIPTPIFAIGAIVLTITPCIILGFVVHSYTKKKSIRTK